MRAIRAHTRRVVFASRRRRAFGSAPRFDLSLTNSSKAFTSVLTAARRTPLALTAAAAPLLLLGAASSPARCDRSTERALAAARERAEQLRRSAAKEAPGRPTWDRLVARSCVLAWHAAPLVAGRLVVAGANAAGLSPAWEDAWWGRCLATVERAGPTFVKLCQWAASRDDLFPAAATARFARLHDRVTPHAFAHTRSEVARTFGEGAVVVEPEVLGSGCVAQVHRGILPSGAEVAVKVVHPGVRELVECDMALLKIAGSALERVAPGLRYLAVRGSIARFEALMRAQLDLRTEAANLEKLHALFAKDEGIAVPRPSSDVGGRDGAQRDVLVEDFVAGVPVLEYFKTHQAEGKELARRGTEAVLKMVLHHNFVHGDLHPGNLLVDATGRLIFLDAGICVEIPDKTHEVMVRVLRAMLENDGDAAARLLLATDRHAAEARDAGSDARETAFVKGFSDFVERTRHQPVFDSLSSYVGDVCRLAVSNRVALDASFVSMALAVKIMEGLVVDMDPTFPFVEVAMPFFMKAQCMRASKKELNKLSAYSRAMLDRLRAEESSTSSV